MLQYFERHLQKLALLMQRSRYSSGIGVPAAAYFNKREDLAFCESGGFHANFL